MGEVREATSPSGGVSRRADVAKGAKRISPHRSGALRLGGISKPKLSANIQISIEVQNLNFALQPA
ncbi:hypothetical protein D1003_02290 [Riemerella anatipestifer]|nr:hypothetical protein [Riemerella anatipestifer]